MFQKKILRKKYYELRKKKYYEIDSEFFLPLVDYLKLKSANIEENTSSYVFWYSLNQKNLNNFLNDIKSMSDKDLNISIYSKSNAHE